MHRHIGYAQPGPLGQRLYENVSKEAWQQWIKMQTMLINEKHLNVRDPETRRYLAEQRERFFDNQAVDEATGYVAPEAGD
jgi:Fe-S cluster biosynthesis and repair protein YggX